MEQSQRESVFIIDDHAITRAALTAEVERFAESFYVVGEAADISSALLRIQQLRPQIVILDHMLKGADGIKALDDLRTINCKIFVFTQVEDPHVLHHYWKNFVVALVSKSSELQDLNSAFAAVIDGRRFISANLEKIISENYLKLLTPREIEVIRLISSGKSNKEVADVLGCTDHTIKTHKANIMEKLGYASTVEVSVWASKNGLI